MFSIETTSRRASFTEIGRTGKSSFWRVLGGLLLLLGGYVLLMMGMLLFFAYVWPGRDISDLETPWYAVDRAQALLDYGAMLASLALLVPVCWAVTRFIHHRPGWSLLSTRPAFDLTGMLWSMGVWAGLQVGLAIILAMFVPGALKPVLDPAAFLPFLLLACILLPLQVLGEEVFFRGYLMQLVGRFTRSPVVILVLPALIFASMHFFNPYDAYNDIWSKGLYVAMALYLGFLVLKTGGLAHSIGLHLGNNFVAIHLMSNEMEPPLAPSVFSYAAPSTMVEFFIQLLVFLLHYLVFFGPWSGALKR